MLAIYLIKKSVLIRSVLIGFVGFFLNKIGFVGIVYIIVEHSN